MVDFIITDFSNVRGGGNIVDTVPSIEDFIVDNCTISSSSSGEFVLTPGASDVGSVSLTVSSASVTVGGTVTLTATVLDDEDDPLEDISVSFRAGSSVIGSDTTDSSGIASYTATMSSAGGFLLTAAAGGVSSSSVTVIVSKIVPTISLSAQSSSVLVGSDVVLNGTLSAGAGESVKIKQGNTVIDTVTTTSGGAFTKTVSNLAVGTYSFTAKFDGNDTYSGVTSSAVSVTVSDVTPTPVVTSVSLTSDKSVLSAYDSESAVLSATVLDQSSNPMSGETVTFYKGSTSIGTATTNNSGIATKSYSATGSGDVTFKATCESIDSSTITVEDCIFYGLNTNAFTIPSSTTFSSNGTYITASTSTSGEKIVTLNHTLANADNWVFENEVAYTGTSEQLLAVIWNDSTYYGGAGYGENYVYSYMGSQTTKTHTVAIGDKFTVRRENGTTSVYINDELIESKTVSHKSSFKVGYFINKGRIQYYKNIKLKAL